MSRSRFLHTASILYLLVPNLIFASGWLRPGLGWTLVLLLLAAALSHLSDRRRERGREPDPEREHGWTRTDTWIAAIAILWAGTSGAGGFGYQNADYLVTHNPTLKDLMVRPWPVLYHELETGIGEHGARVSYLAWYLPGARVGKLLGWQACQLATFAWTLAGTLLALFWFAEHQRRRSVGTVLVFLATSGLHFLGWMLARGQIPVGTHGPLQWAGSFVAFPGVFPVLYWSPQHALGAWVLTGLLMDMAFHAKSSRGAVFAWSLSFLFSPMVSLGAIPFVVLVLVQARGSRLSRLPDLGAAPVLGLLFLAWYSAHLPVEPQGWLTTFWGIRHWNRLVLFYFLEFGVHLWIASGLVRETSARRDWYLAGLAVLVVAPWYRLGTYGDLCMRMPLPAQFVLAGALARCLDEAGRRLAEPRVQLLLGTMALGAMGPLAEIARLLDSGPWGAPPIEAVMSMSQVPRREQYLGTLDSFFFRHLAPIRASARVGDPGWERERWVRVPDVPVSFDFESSKLPGWTRLGKAFRSGPEAAAGSPWIVPDRFRGQGCVGSCHERAEDTGVLVSRPFPILGTHMGLLVGGTADLASQAVELLVDGERVHRATGEGDDRMRRSIWYVAPWRGRLARLRIRDYQGPGPQACITVDDVVQFDMPDGLLEPWAGIRLFAMVDPPVEGQARKPVVPDRFLAAWTAQEARLELEVLEAELAEDLGLPTRDRELPGPGP